MSTLQFQAFHEENGISQIIVFGTLGFQMCHVPSHADVSCIIDISMKHRIKYIYILFNYQ